MGTSVLGQQVGTINLPEFLVPHQDCFMVVVAGNCLAPDHILDGDAVLIDPLAPVNDGDICAVWWQGGKALKHVYRDGDAIRLVPSDPAYDTIILGPEHRPVTVGLVVAVIRPCE